MEFKGTKGKWYWVYPSGNNIAELLSDEGGEICNFGNSEQYYPTEGEAPNEYDALLISKAPEMLEFLNQLAYACENGLIEDLQELGFSAEKLVKEATTL